MILSYKIRKYVICEFDYIVDTQLCKMRNMSRLYHIFTEFPSFMISRSRVFFTRYVFPCQGYRRVAYPGQQDNIHNSMSTESACPPPGLLVIFLQFFLQIVCQVRYSPSKYTVMHVLYAYCTEVPSPFLILSAVVLHFCIIGRLTGCDCVCSSH